MNRRGFLKVITALGASVALPVGDTSIEQAAEAMASGVAPLGLMREVWAYDISMNRILLRFDICTGVLGKLSGPNDVQLGVDMAFSSKEEMDSRMDESREIAKKLFNNELKQRGLDWDDLIPMEPLRSPA